MSVIGILLIPVFIFTARHNWRKDEKGGLENERLGPNNWATKASGAADGAATVWVDSKGMQ